MRRWTFVGAVTMLFAVVLGGSAVAGGGGGGAGGFIFGGPVGRNVQSQHSADAFALDPTGFTSVNVFVTAGGLKFKAKGTTGPPRSMIGTQLSLGISSSDAVGSGCWVIPDSMFVLNSDLTATVHFRSDAAGVVPCPGFAIASGLPHSGIVPLGGVGGVEFGFIGPVAFDMSWQPGQVLAARDTTNSSCGPFSGHTEGTFSAALNDIASGDVSATLAEPPGAPPLVLNTTIASLFADTDTLDEATVVHGPATGSCGPFGS